MTSDLMIIGCGARTPLGYNRASSAAAVRAGISNVAEHPDWTDRFGEPMKLALDAALPVTLSGVDRLLAMGLPAARAALAPLACNSAVPAVSVIISLGEPRPGQGLQAEGTFADAFRQALGDRVSIDRTACWMGGHAGGLLAIAAAERLIEEGRAELVLAGGVDSYLTRDTMEWLDDTEQLHSEGNTYGFIPGEAAGFVLVARADTGRRLSLAPLARLVSIGAGLEQARIGTEDICLGEGLATAFRAAANALPPNLPVDRILCDMNGERYRGNEYGFAVLKTPGLFRNAGVFETPADCWGDVGAATGPLCAALVIEAAARGYSKGPLSLIWASSNSGQRGSAILHR